MSAGRTGEGDRESVPQIEGAGDGAVEAFRKRMWRTDLPTDDAAAVTMCGDAWSDAKIALERADMPDAPDAHASFFKAMCRWRTHFSAAKLGADARAAVFVVMSAARLVLMDAINGEAARVQALGAQLGSWRSGVREPELAGLNRFIPSASRDAWRERMIGAAGAWFCAPPETSWPSCWSECATLTLLLGEQGDSPQAEEVFLRFAGEMDADCALRAAGVSQLRSISFEPVAPITDAELQTAREWLTSKASAAGESLGERARETMCRATLPPWALRRLGVRKASAAIGEFVRDDARIAQCALGLRGITQEMSEEDLGLLLAACVCYFAEQACSFRLEEKLFVFDNDPALLRDRFLGHRADRVLGPPPLLLRTHDGTYLAHRRREPGAHTLIERHASLARAVVAWVRYVHDVRADVLFLDRRMGTFADALLGRVEQSDNTIRLSSRDF